MNDLEKWSHELNIEDKPIKRLLNAKRTSTDLRLLLEWATIFCIRLQERAGLDLVWDGELWRSEMYEDAVKYIGGFKFTTDYRGILAFDDNYFRSAECRAPVHFRNPYHLEEFRFVKAHATRTVKVPVTDAHTICDWSYNIYYQKKSRKNASAIKKAKYEARRDFALDLASGPINENLKELRKAGAQIIQLDGPAAITDIREFDREQLRRLGHELPLYVEAFNEATKGVDAEFHVHICFPPDTGYEKLFPYVAEMRKCAQFSLEFANRDTTKAGTTPSERTGYESLNTFKEYSEHQRVGLGVTDIHSDFIEPPQLIRDRTLYAAKLVGEPDLIAVTQDCGLRTRSWQVAYQKLSNMVKGADLARDAYE